MLKIYLLSCLLLGAAWAAPAQTLDPTFASPASVYAPGTVLALGPAQADGKRIIIGEFQRVSGQPAAMLARLDASGALDAAFTQQVGVVGGSLTRPYRVRAGVGGQYLLPVSDGTVTAGGLTRNGLLRLQADGSADASFNPGTAASDIEDVAVQPDGKVLVVGSFSDFAGTPANGVVRLNADGSVDSGFAVGTGPDDANGIQTVLVQPSGQVLVGGSFYRFGGQLGKGLMRLNANGSVDATFQTPLPDLSNVSALVAQPDGKILVVTWTNGQEPRLLRLLASGAPDPGFAPAALGYLGTSQEPLTVLPNGQVLVLGTFGSGYMARLNSDGSVDNTFALSAPPSGRLSALGVQPNGDLLLAASGFDYHFGSLASPLAAFSSAGALRASYNPRPQVGGTVRAVARQVDGALLAGGYFNEWGGQPVSNLVRVSSAGVLDAAFAAAGPLPGAVQALALQPNGQALAATNHGLLRLTTAGAPDNSFASFLGDRALTILAVQPDGRILTGWAYGPPDGSNCLVRLLPGGARDASFVRTELPYPGGTTRTVNTTESLLVQADGRLVASGWITTTNPGGTVVNRGNYLTRYEASGAPDPTFTPVQLRWGGAALLPIAYCLIQQADGKLLAGGLFDQAGGTAAPRVARFTTTGQPDATFAPPAIGNGSYYGTVYSLAVQPNGRVLVGGNFPSPAGGNLLRLLADGQPDASFATQSPPDAAVLGLLVQPDGGIVAGGSFSTLVGQPAVRLARITAPNVLAVAAPAAALAAVAAATSAWPVPARERLHVLPAPTAHPLAAELLDALGRVVLSRELTSAAEFTLDTQALPAGRYVLRLRYAEGTVSRHLSVE